MRGAAAYAAGSSGGVRVSYGHIPIPRLTDTAHGGIVKLRSLSREFPDTAFHFNVFYAVSSRLPDGAVTFAHWARRKGAKVILNQNGVAYPAWHGKGWEHTNAPMRALLEVADHVFYQSSFCKLSADRFLGLPRAGWEVLHNAVDTATFTPAAELPAQPLTLLLGGSQDQHYRFESAVRTVASLKRRGHSVRLIVTGRLRWTPDERQCRREAEALLSSLDVHDDVILTGPYSQREAPQLFRRAHMLIHTKYNDPCPTVVIEAMSCGLPVVFSASGGVPELVGDAGIGVPAELSWERDIPPDPETLAGAVEAVARNRETYSRKARERAVRSFDINHWLARHRAVFTAS